MRYIHTVVAIMWISIAAAKRPYRGIERAFKPTLIDVPDYDMVRHAYVQFTEESRVKSWQ